MDFLDSLDLDTTHRKSHRVRSWYLYEQYKSLEKNQLEAAQKLKNRSYQDSILRKELSERRARRKIYDQFGLCQSESVIERSIKSADSKRSRTISTDDIFESFCELHEQEECLSQVTDLDSSEVSDGTFISQDDSIQNKPYSEDYKSIEDSKDNSYSPSVSSVVEIPKCVDNLAYDAKEMVRKSLAESLNMQLEAVKEDIQCMENFTKLSDCKSFSTDSVITVQNSENVEFTKIEHEYDNNIIAMWSKVVSFAYQVVQLNHGNCYYDYSYQFMTAVLACDVLRRGVNRMCHILQPYVSPVKYATDDYEGSIEIHKNAKRNKCLKRVPSVKFSKVFVKKQNAENKAITNNKRPRFNRRHESVCWRRPHSKYSMENQNPKTRGASEPVPVIHKGDSERFSSSSIWPAFSKENSKKLCCCCRHKNVVKSISQIAQYIDSILQDIDDSYS